MNVHSLISVIVGPSVAVLLAGAMLTSPSRAVAECGHYVTILNSSKPFDHKADPPQPFESPCEGPTCSNHLPVPTAPVPAAANSKPEVKAALVSTDDAGRGTWRRFGFSKSQLLLADRPDSIFHPPRGGSFPMPAPHRYR
jgi:hypothetical protein